MIKELGQQIGGLGDKFGYFTEGMALPSMERILTEQFGMSVIMPRVRVRQRLRSSRSICSPTPMGRSTAPSWWRSRAK